MNKKIVLFIFSVFLLASCKTREKTSSLNYFQNADQIATEASQNYTASTIQEGDQFIILVTAKDMTVVKPFNQNYSSAETIQSSIPSANQPLSSQENFAGPIYVVDSEGVIDFPVLGKLQASGKTMVQFKDELRERITYYVKNPSVSMKITNYKVTVLGEVRNPGQYTVQGGKTTLLNALGLAGDLTTYGRRNDVLVVRNENGQITKERIDLMDSSFISSPFYYLKQGDVIYVSANETKEKEARLDPNTGTYVAIAGMIIGLAGIFITIFKN